MKFRRNALILGAAAVTALSTLAPMNFGVVAQESTQTGTNLSDEKGEVTEAAQGVQDLNLAYSLAEYGRENEDPQLLIAAAKIIMETPVQYVTREKTSEANEGEDVATGTKTEADEPEFTAMELLEEARELAQDDPTLIAMIDELESTAGTRGRVGGPARHVDRVNAYSTDVYRLPFYGGRLASIYVEGDGDTDLDCYVYDENGNLIDRDVDYTDTCLLQWNPSWTGNFTLRVRNLGPVYNRYLLSTN